MSEQERADLKAKKSRSEFLRHAYVLIKNIPTNPLFKADIDEIYNSAPGLLQVDVPESFFSEDEGVKETAFKNDIITVSASKWLRTALIKKFGSDIRINPHVSSQCEESSDGTVCYEGFSAATGGTLGMNFNTFCSARNVISTMVMVPIAGRLVVHFTYDYPMEQLRSELSAELRCPNK